MMSLLEMIRIVEAEEEVRAKNKAAERQRQAAQQVRCREVASELVNEVNRAHQAVAGLNVAARIIGGHPAKLAISSLAQERSLQIEVLPENVYIVSRRDEAEDPGEGRVTFDISAKEMDREQMLRSIVTLSREGG